MTPLDKSVSSSGAAQSEMDVNIQTARDSVHFRLPAANLDGMEGSNIEVTEMGILWSLLERLDVVMHRDVGDDELELISCHETTWASLGVSITFEVTSYNEDELHHGTYQACFPCPNARNVSLELMSSTWPCWAEVL